MALIQLGLYCRAASKTDELCLSQLDRLLVSKEQSLWSVQTILGFVVAILASVFISSIAYLVGILNCLTPLGILLVTQPRRKKYVLYKILSRANQRIVSRRSESSMSM